MRTRGTTVLFVLLSIGIGFEALAEPLHVVATTTIVGDVIGSIAGDLVQLDVLFPIGADPHSFQPTPRDAVTVAEADVVFVSGGGLEASIEDLLANATGQLVDLYERLRLRGVWLAPSAPDVKTSEEARDNPPLAADPHVWFDPTLVMIWTDVIEETLSELDPANAAAYATAAAGYRSALADLDLWVWEQVARLPRARRRLVSDHLAFGRLAARYGFEQVGSVFPGFSTLAEPSAREVADLVDTIRSLGVSAIFVGTTVRPSLAETVAADSGVKVVRLYTGSLSDESGPASTYLEMVRYDVAAIVEALSTPIAQE
jgi:ABC-type Zn uptake system ZnuABC Zn-binding protein ZnuA